MINKLLILALLTLFVNSKAQKNSSQIIYDAYINNKMDTWKNECDGLQQNPSNSNESLISLINMQYGFIANCLASNKKKDALTYLKLAENNLQMLEKKKYRLSTVMAYKSIFYSFQASLDNKVAIKCGIKSLEFAEIAIKEDCANYLGYYQRGNIYRYTPEIFNGSSKKAIEYYLKAESLLKREIGYNIKNWNYLHLLVSITETYIELKDFKEATKYCNKILKIESDFYLVKDILLAKIQSQTK
jgi:hypothetical protein